MTESDRKILAENKRRLDLLFAHYDPDTGEGSLIPRFPFLVYSDLRQINLPVTLKEKYGSIKSLDTDFKKVFPEAKTFQNALIYFEADRIKHDFEYWAFTCVKIKPKEGGAHIPFRLNRPQRRLVAELEKMRVANKPIRLILLKCRQWGGSTLVQIYAAWIQMLHKTNWNSMIAAHLNGPANNIRYMYRTMIDNYPGDYGDYTWSGFEGTQNSRMIKERDCKITVGSMETPDSIRSDDISIAHLCLAPGTRVPTSDGVLKKIEDIDYNDWVTTHNGHKAKVKCVTGNKPDKRNGNGDAIKITPWMGQPITLTPNHPIWTNRGWVEAGEVTKNDLLSYPIRKLKDEIYELQLPIEQSRPQGGGRICAASGKMIPLNEEIGFAIGYYLAEGCVHKRKNGNWGEISLTRHDDDFKLGDRAIKAFMPFCSKHTRKNKKNCLTTVELLYSSVLAKFLVTEFGHGAENKRVPDWVFNSNKNFIKGLIKGYFSGDGNKSNDQQGKYELASLRVTTVSSSFAMQFRDLVLSMGYGWGSLDYKKAGNYYGRNCKESYHLRWHGSAGRKLRLLLGHGEVKHNNHTFTEKWTIDDKYVWFKIRNIEKCMVEYVYDLEVDHPDHSFKTWSFSVKNSEIGLWKETKGKKPKDLIQSVSGSIEPLPYTMLILESTAKGTGNYFHKTWLAACKPNSTMVPFFVPWHETEKDTMSFTSDQERLEFYHSLDEYETKLWTEFEATLEGINWYRFKFNSPEIDQDVWRMNSENPSSVEEAFQATGRKVHPPHYVATLKENLRKPLIIGDIFGEASEGKDAFKNLRIEAVPKGNLHVWRLPNTPALKHDEIGKNGRCAVFVDVGGRSADSDYSVISGFDRYWMAKGGEPERCFTWRGHIDPDLLAWKAAQLAYFYEKALLAFEINTYASKHQNTEGEHSFTVIDTIADYYDNLYTRTRPEDIKEGIAAKWGFHTNHQTKGMLVDNFNRLLRMNHESGSGYIEYDERAYFETDFFEHKDDGTMGAVDGEHDDVYVTTAGATWLCTSYMEPYIILRKEQEIVSKSALIKSHASM